MLAKLVKKVDGKEVPETFEASYLIGADGGKGMVSPLIVYVLADFLYRLPLGACRKFLGLTFLGETRDEMNSVVGDICMEVDGLDREVWVPPFDSRDLLEHLFSTGISWVIGTAICERGCFDGLKCS